MSRVVRIIKSGCRIFLWAHLFVWPVGLILHTWDFLPSLPVERILTTDALSCFLAFMTMFTLRNYHSPSAAEEWLASAEHRVQAIESRLSSFEYKAHKLAHRLGMFESRDY